MARMMRYGGARKEVDKWYRSRTCTYVSRGEEVVATMLDGKASGTTLSYGGSLMLSYNMQSVIMVSAPTRCACVCAMNEAAGDL